MPHAARLGECLPSASTPDVPDALLPRALMGTVLSPGSVLGWKREIADWASADVRRRYQSLQSLTITLFAGDAHPVTSLLEKVPWS
jgi:hypothetical protein